MNPDVTITSNSSHAGIFADGEEAVLLCTVHLNTVTKNISLIWSKNDETISNNSGLYAISLVMRNSAYYNTLTIRQLSINDSGVGYTCQWYIDHFYSNSVEGNDTIYLTISSQLYV